MPETIGHYTILEAPHQAAGVMPLDGPHAGRSTTLWVVLLAAIALLGLLVSAAGVTSRG